LATAVGAHRPRSIIAMMISGAIVTAIGTVLDIT